MATSLERRITEIVAEQLGLESKEITAASSLIEDLGADSLDIVELIMAFEEEFDLDIPDEDAEKIATVKDAVEYIRKKIQ